MVAAVGALAAISFVLVGPASAAPKPSPTTSTTAPAGGGKANGAQPSGAQIANARSSVGQIESTIAYEQARVSALAEQFDQATVELQSVQAALAATDRQLAAATAAAGSATDRLRADALNAYMYDEAGNQLAQLFTSPSDAMTVAIGDEYQRTAFGNLSADIAARRTDASRLTRLEAALRTERRQAQGVTATIEQSEQQAEATAAASEALLGQVKGRLAALVARHAAAQAAAAARAAAKAANPAARARDAAQAAQDASVAQSVGAGSAAATAAADAAGQAAGTAGTIVSGPPLVGAGPGAVAVSAAETFLGVPYVWGGAGSGGVDCSGLTLLAWRAAGVTLTHSAAVQYQESTHVPLSALRPGDLLFYNLDGSGIDHVTMYVGSGPYGVHTIIQAAHTGTVVSFGAIWYGGLVGAARP